MAKDSDKTTLILIVVALALVYFFVASPPSIGPAEQDWQENYLIEAELAGLDPNFFKHNELVDITPEIQSISKSISDNSINSKDAIKKTMDYVFNTVTYTSSPPGCFEETSSDVYRLERGNCVGMTKLTLSLLRAQGIAARPAGGCISGNFACGVIFSAHPERQPRFVPVDPDDNFKRGGLHEWLEIWHPQEGWIIGEATSAQLFSRSCSSYDTHDHNTDSIGMCVITDQNYIRQCARF